MSTKGQPKGEFMRRVNAIFSSIRAPDKMTYRYTYLLLNVKERDIRQKYPHVDCPFEVGQGWMWMVNAYLHNVHKYYDISVSPRYLKLDPKEDFKLHSVRSIDGMIRFAYSSSLDLSALDKQWLKRSSHHCEICADQGMQVEHQGYLMSRCGFHATTTTQWSGQYD